MCFDNGTEGITVDVWSLRNIVVVNSLQNNNCGKGGVGAIGMDFADLNRKPDSALSVILDSPVSGKTYKLPPRTVSLIESLSHEYGTKGKVLAAIAYMLSQPSLQAGLTRAPLNPPGKVILEPGETPESHLRKHEREVAELTSNAHKRKRNRK